MKIKPTPNPGCVTVELNRRDETLMAEAIKDDEAKMWPAPVKNILVPIDFSESSRRALEYALPLAEKLGATLTLIHVIEPRPTPEEFMLGTESDVVDAQWIKRGRNMLDSLRKEKIQPDITSISIVTKGKPWQQIIATAKAVAADLVIIATHGRTGLKHVLMGSTAERVVRHAHCPVLTVREPEIAICSRCKNHESQTR